MVKDSPLAFKAFNSTGSYRYEKDTQDHYESQAQAGPWVSRQDGHQGWAAGPEQKAS
jgi:hypothetical protein